jgi:hypothetical protein
LHFSIKANDSSESRTDKQLPHYEIDQRSPIYKKQQGESGGSKGCGVVSRQMNWKRD